MTDRLADLTARIGSAQQLESVMTAMRGIAAARAKEARDQLGAVRNYAASIAEAIGRVLAMTEETAAHDAAPETREQTALIVLAAEQGFAGVFDDRVLDAAEDEAAMAPTRILLAGDRGRARASERGMAVAWSTPMIAHADQANELADRLARQLYQRMANGEATRAVVVHAAPDVADAFVIRRAVLAPFDYTRFPRARTRDAPLLHMAPDQLLARLAVEYVFAELCEAAVLSFAAENQARMRAMTSARANVRDTLDELRGSAQRLRQDEITNEIIELFAGASSVAGARRKY